MRLPFKGTYRLSQAFGVNKDAYAKFGYLGHNGLDHAVPTGTDLFAMISGTVIEARMDTTGYGNYVKIENDKEGALVGHMQSLAVKPGDKVVEGETFIGKSNNTGNSTGPHTHTGYYTLPRNRQNGYGGYIDFTNLLNGEPMTSDEIAVKKTDFENLVAKSSKLDEILAKYGVADADGLYRYVAGINSRVTDLTNQLGTAQAEEKNKEEIIGRNVATIANLNSDINNLQDRLNQSNATVAQLGKDKGNLAIQVSQLQLQVDTLKQQQTQGEVTLSLGDLFKMLLAQKVTIRR